MSPRPLSVAYEIRQSRPFQSTGHEVVVTLIRTAAVVTARGTKLLATAGITPPQYNVLRILRGAGAEGLPTLAIGERMLDLSPGVTRLVDRLEKAGLVVRERSNADRREVRCRITSAGLALLKKLDAPVDLADRELVSRLSPAEQRTLVRLLDIVRTTAAELTAAQ
jgi:DNA-binding MarR family transcriptional regulator